MLSSNYFNGLNVYEDCDKILVALERFGYKYPYDYYEAEEGLGDYQYQNQVDESRDSERLTECIKQASILSRKIRDAKNKNDTDKLEEAEAELKAITEEVARIKKRTRSAKIIRKISIFLKIIHILSPIIGGLMIGSIFREDWTRRDAAYLRANLPLSSQKKNGN